ncbi:uncharacterized protein LOC143955672 isoform X2 [Lithobates pipiens]
MRMEKNESHMTEKILNLTLEIIYLLTGERFPLVKSGDHMTITVPPCDSLKPERHNMEKILEVTKKMMELLTGEGENPSDYNIVIKEEYEDEEEEYGVMKEFSEGYKDFVMEPPNTRNPPERCPRPLYSRDSTQEDHTIPHHHQSGNLRDPKVEGKEEIKEEDDEDGVTEELEHLKEHKDLYQDTMVESSSYRNPPERCPRPLDSTQEGHTIPHHHQVEDLMDKKVEGKSEEEEEERYVRDDQQSMEEDGITGTFIEEDTPTEISTGAAMKKPSKDSFTSPCTRWKMEDEEITGVCAGEKSMEEDGITGTFIEEDTPTEISTGHAMEKPSKDLLTLSPGCRMGDEDITGDCGGEKTMISTMDGGLHSVDRPWNPSDSEQPCTVRDGAGVQGEKRFFCHDCGKSFQRNSLLVRHQRSHTGEKPYSCSQCGKCYSQKSQLVRHERCHTGEMPFCCFECGNCYPLKSELVTHQKSHSMENAYSCPECGKSYPQKSLLVRHQRSHTGEKPYSCLECGKCFSQGYHLYRHQKSHTGEKPYSCSECGKCFTQESHLYRHQKSHTGQRPYACLECGKSFPQKFHLDRHQRTHTALK